MKRRYGLAAIACLAVGYATVIHSLGWAETSNFALVRAFSDGTPEIDRWHWETKDKSWHDGRFYSVKAPGLALVATPAYEALTAVGRHGGLGRPRPERARGRRIAVGTRGNLEGAVLGRPASAPRPFARRSSNRRRSCGRSG